MDLKFCISPESHVAEFTCVICCCLIDLTASVTRPCSHAFCKTCLASWLKKAERCPTCNWDLHDGVNTTLVDDLAKAQPLAYRVLRRIRIRCPWGACDWTGDYGDLQAHMVESTDHDNILASSASSGQNFKQLAQTFKDQGDDKFKSSSYAEAVALYTRAVQMYDTETITASDGLYASILANRAACYLTVRNYDDCIRDCDLVLKYDPSYYKAAVRRGKALTELGQFETACRVIDELCDPHTLTDNGVPQILAAEVTRCFNIRSTFQRGMFELLNRNYVGAKSTFGSLLKATAASCVVLGTARAELGMGLVDRALRLALQVNRTGLSAEALEISGRATALSGDFDRAMELFKEASRLDPDLESNKGAIRQTRTVRQVFADARAAVFNRDFPTAVGLYEVAKKTYDPKSGDPSCDPIPVRAPLHAILYSESAGARLRMKDYEGCVKDCAVCLYGKDDCVEAWLHKASALHGLGRSHDALSEIEPLMQQWGSSDSRIRAAYEKAVFEVKKLERTDYYKLFGLPTVCSEMEIKKQYKVKALELHPDKWRIGEGMGECTLEEAKWAEEQFKLLGEGLEILTDGFKRQLYDEGYDKKSIEERVAAAQRAAHREQGHGHGHNTG
jgi:tetratricopeptide (TPR) repeat protein